MKMVDGMKDNLRFDKNENVEHASQILNLTIPKDYCFSGYTSGFDEDTGDVLIFIPWEWFPEELLPTLRKNWNEAGFEISEERFANSREYFHVGFHSRFFRLKNQKQ